MGLKMRGYLRPTPGKATIKGLLSTDTGSVSAIVTIYDAAEQTVTLNKKTPVGVYSEKVTGLAGAGAPKYVLDTIGNSVGKLTITK